MRLIFATTFILFGLTLSSLSERDLILEKFSDQPKELFKVYHYLFDKAKDYDLDSEEGVKRYKIFKDNLKWNNERNAELGRQVYGITQFTDWTHQEFVDKILVKPSVIDKHFKDTVSMTSIDNTHAGVPQSGGNIDWRSKLNTPKDQKTCGSCYAFAAIGAVEGNYNIKFNTLLNLSEQYLVECDSDDFGCGGGYPGETMKWLTSNGVLKSEQLPYKAKRTYCDSDIKNQAMNIVDGAESCVDCAKDKWIELLQKGPIVVSMDASDPGFANYRPIKEEPWVPRQKCGELNHAVLAVGFVIENGIEYLIVRNSLGPTWGIKGYFKVAAKDHCGILKNGWLPKVKNHQPFSPTKCSEFYSECGYKGKVYSTCTGVNNFSAVIGGPAVGWKPLPETNFNFYLKQNCQGPLTFKYNTSPDNDCFIKKDSKNQFLSAAVANETPQWGCVYLYEGECRTGRKITLCNSLPDIKMINLKQVRSISVNREPNVIMGNLVMTGIVFYDQVNYEGKAYGLKNFEVLELSNPDAKAAIANAKSIGLVYAQ